MPLQPLTHDGVNYKQAELYALSDAALLVEARALIGDLLTWLGGHFSLTAKQQAYIGSMPDNVKVYLSAVLGSALITRSPIDMGTPPNYGPPRRTKEIVVTPCGENSWFPPVSGPGTLAGTFPVTISFNLVD